MTAASFWSLLSPALEITEQDLGHLSFLPVALGFVLGAAFVYFADVFLAKLGVSGSVVDQLKSNDAYLDMNTSDAPMESPGPGNPWGSNAIPSSPPSYHQYDTREGMRQRGVGSSSQLMNDSGIAMPEPPPKANDSWRRILLLLIAIVVHNIPEGLVVGVGFGAIGSTPSATFESAVSLAIGIGIQNFPEGLAVSLPLAGFGYSKLKSFWYGQLSGKSNVNIRFSFQQPFLSKRLSESF